MRYISPLDNGSYHMGTIRTNRTSRQLGEGFLGIQHVRNILSPPNEMPFSIRQWVVSHGHDSLKLLFKTPVLVWVLMVDLYIQDIQ